MFRQPDTSPAWRGGVSKRLTGRIFRDSSKSRHGLAPRACLKIARDAAAGKEYPHGMTWRPSQRGPQTKDPPPGGFRAKDRLASLPFGRRPMKGILPRRASPSSFLLENSTPRDFQAGSTGVPPFKRSFGQCGFAVGGSSGLNRPASGNAPPGGAAARLRPWQVATSIPRQGL